MRGSTLNQKRKLALATGVCAAALAYSAPRAANAQQYLDVNTAAAGNGLTSGSSYDWAGTIWSTDATGSTATVAYSTALDTIIAPAADVSISISNLAANRDFRNVTIASGAVTISGAGTLRPQAASYVWTTALGAALNIQQTINLSGRNMSFDSFGAVTIGGGFTNSSTTGATVTFRNGTTVLTGTNSTGSNSSNFVVAGTGAPILQISSAANMPSGTVVVGNSSNYEGRLELRNDTNTDFGTKTISFTGTAGTIYADRAVDGSASNGSHTISSIFLNNGATGTINSGNGFTLVSSGFSTGTSTASRINSNSTAGLKIIGVTALGQTNTFGGTGVIELAGDVRPITGQSSKNLQKLDTGTLILSGASVVNDLGNGVNYQFNGGLVLLSNASSLRGGIGAGLASGSTLQVGGGTIGLTSASANFYRDSSGTTSAGKIFFTSANSGGFAAFGGNRIVNLGGASSQLTWGDSTGGGFLSSGGTMLLSHATADGTLDFQNPMNIGSKLGGGAATFQVANGSAEIDALLSGTISSAGTGASNLNTFIKSGAGTLAMTAANTYTGPTAVQAGTLLVNNSHSVAGDYTVGGSAILGGTGQISLASAAAVTLVGSSASSLAHIAPGDPTASNGIGTLIVGSDSSNKVVMGNYSDLSVQINGTTPDLLQIYGDLDLSSTLDQVTVSLTGTQAPGSRYVVATYTGSLIGDGTNPAVFDSVIGTGFTLDYAATGEIAVVTVPEPSAVGAAAAALGMVVIRRRRRR